MDFTTGKYKLLLSALKGCGVPFACFSEIAGGQIDRFIVMRHDVDKKPENALKLARIEAEESVKASYHFRAEEGGFHDSYVSEISGLGHEIAYHYEDLSVVAARLHGSRNEIEPPVVAEAVARFRMNLGRIRRLSPVKVISMHGSPLSPTDNRLLWRYHDYHSDGIICEPYMDIDMSDILYLTDTGRRWDGDESAVRDRGYIAGEGVTADPYHGWTVKPLRGSLMNMTREGMVFRRRYSIRTTDEMINLAINGHLPGRLIINTHPQRWNDDPFAWVTELIMQNLKNQIKKFIRISKNLA
ncbi:MAG: hypothetical protein QUS66_08450 [Bacteroidota bacterium]|jgi:hypothetical protein|nr:hypothetical protein [Bacteroidota bacterium]